MNADRARAFLARAVGRGSAAAAPGRRPSQSAASAPAATPREPAAVPDTARSRPLQIHRVRGRDLVDALERAARQHGEAALVLSREPAPGGGVTVAVGVPSLPLARPTAPAEPLDPGAAEVERRLRRSGASDELVRRALEAARARAARGAFAIDAAAETLGGLVTVAPSPRVRSRGEGAAGHVIAFVGPAGVGKTTTLAKLASRLVRAGRRIALVSTDARSVAGRAQLAAYGELLQAPVVACVDGRQLADAVIRSRHVDAVLVDTSGRSPRDGEALRRLADELDLARASGPAAPGLDVYLTVPATAGRPALDETLLGFEAARPSALVVTKLDETREPAHVLEFAHGTGLPAAFLCDGPEISAHLHRTTPDRVADLLLRGRIA